MLRSASLFFALAMLLAWAPERAQANDTFCNTLSANCTHCTATGSGCGFCLDSMTCVNGTEGGPLLGVCTGWYFDGQCPGCEQHSDCASCSGDDECGWCGLFNECRRGTADGDKHGVCKDWRYDACDITCNSFSTNCTACSDAMDDTCGWCESSLTCIPMNVTTVVVDAALNITRRDGEPLQTCDWVFFDECPVCSNYSSCGSCPTDLGCGWCELEQRCVNADAGGNGPADNTTMCHEWFYDECPVCANFTNCARCPTDLGCGWCDSSSECLSGTVARADRDAGLRANESCAAWYFDTCPKCSNYTTCKECPTELGCGWCEHDHACLEGGWSGPDDNSTSLCAAGDMWFFNECPVCSNYTLCSDCSADAGCGWCESTRTCHDGLAGGPDDGNCPSNWFFDKCPDCSNFTSCDRCDAHLGCGWCAETNTCWNGTADGPAGVGGADVCEAGLWFYNECPECSDMYRCDVCRASDGCGWCHSTDSCHPAASPSSGPTDATTCDRFFYGHCPQCSNFTHCDKCPTEYGCGWCNAEHACVPGNATIAHEGVCAGNDTTWYPGTCPPCAEQTRCGDCSHQHNCGWCRMGLLSPEDGSCFEGTAFGDIFYPDWWNATTDACHDWQFDTCDDECAVHANCTSCALDDRCGWCQSKQLCMRSDAGEFPVAGNCTVWFGDTCDCSGYTSCDTCARDSNCGWCDSTDICSELCFDTLTDYEPCVTNYTREVEIECPIPQENCTVFNPCRVNSTCPEEYACVANVTESFEVPCRNGSSCDVTCTVLGSSINATCEVVADELDRIHVYAETCAYPLSVLGITTENNCTVTPECALFQLSSRVTNASQVVVTPAPPGWGINSTTARCYVNETSEQNTTCVRMVPCVVNSTCEHNTTCRLRVPNEVSCIVQEPCVVQEACLVPGLCDSFESCDGRCEKDVECSGGIEDGKCLLNAFNTKLWCWGISNTTGLNVSVPVENCDLGGQICEVRNESGVIQCKVKVPCSVAGLCDVNSTCPANGTCIEMVPWQLPNKTCVETINCTVQETCNGTVMVPCMVEAPCVKNDTRPINTTCDVCEYEPTCMRSAVCSLNETVGDVRNGTYNATCALDDDGNIIPGSCYVLQNVFVPEFINVTSTVGNTTVVLQNATGNGTWIVRTSYIPYTHDSGCVPTANCSALNGTTGCPLREAEFTTHVWVNCTTEQLWGCAVNCSAADCASPTAAESDACCNATRMIVYDACCARLAENALTNGTDDRVRVAFSALHNTTQCAALSLPCATHTCLGSEVFNFTGTCVVPSECPEWSEFALCDRNTTCDVNVSCPVQCFDTVMEFRNSSCVKNTTLVPKSCNSNCSVFTHDFCIRSPCIDRFDCDTCTDHPHCGWCNSTQTCIDGALAGPRKAECPVYYYAFCDSPACFSFHTCGDCELYPYCGWCNSTRDCVDGSAFGPTEGECGDFRWGQCDVAVVGLPLGGAVESVGGVAGGIDAGRGVDEVFLALPDVVITTYPIAKQLLFTLSQDGGDHISFVELLAQFGVVPRASSSVAAGDDGGDGDDATKSVMRSAHGLGGAVVRGRHLAHHHVSTHGVREVGTVSMLREESDALLFDVSLNVPNDEQVLVIPPHLSQNDTLYVTSLVHGVAQLEFEVGVVELSAVVLSNGVSVTNRTSSGGEHHFYFFDMPPRTGSLKVELWRDSSPSNQPSVYVQSGAFATIENNAKSAMTHQETDRAAIFFSPGEVDVLRANADGELSNRVYVTVRGNFECESLGDGRCAYSVRATFEDEPILHNGMQLQAHVDDEQWTFYRLDVSSVQEMPMLVVETTGHDGGYVEVYVKRGAYPTPTDFDLSPGMSADYSFLTINPCDNSVGTWYVGVLAHTVPDTLLHYNATFTAERLSSVPGETVYTHTCCGQWKFHTIDVPRLPMPQEAQLVLRSTLWVLSGTEPRGIFLSFGTCPTSASRINYDRTPRGNALGETRLVMDEMRHYSHGLWYVGVESAADMDVTEYFFTFDIVERANTDL